jgi:cytosine/adenosine deaminase-related metal-dependent hydrolase
VLLNLRNIEYPYIDPEVSLVEAVVYRGRSQDVDTVMVDGDVVMRDGRLTLRRGARDGLPHLAERAIGGARGPG